MSQMKKISFLTLMAAMMASPAFAAIDAGDTSWLLAATGLVLFMVPGVAFFYSGMVSQKNFVSTLFQNMIPVGVVAVLWVLVGFSLSFSSGNGFIGDLKLAMFAGVTGEPDGESTIPYVLFAMFQMMFAIITPALITGCFAERVRFSSWILFLGLWHLAVYVPVAHWVWGAEGWLLKKGALDFAGGFVVHMTSGFSALVLAKLMGERKSYGTPQKPYNVGFVLLGTSFIAFGWFGFNAGSALAANGIAAMAWANTMVAAATGMLSWVLIDRIKDGKPTLMGACIGVVVGLVAITPAAGFVTIGGGMLIGLIAGAVCNLISRFIHKGLKIDDTLDVFGCHGIGGFVGSILTALFATTQVNSAGADGLFMGGGLDLFSANLTASIAVAAYSMLVTFILFKIVNAIRPMRVTEEVEAKGLDETQHGESV